MRALQAALMVALVAACAADADPYDQAYQRCLRQPDFEDQTARACTVVIDSVRTSAEDRAFALNNRAQLQQPEQAAADLDAAIGLAPAVAKLHLNRAQRRDDPRRAIADLDEAIRLDPNYAVAWTARGEVHATHKRYGLAIRDLSEAIRLAPRYVHPMYNPYESRAQAKEARGDRRGAAADRELSQRYFEVPAEGDDIAGANASGMRAWEPFLVR